MPYTPYSFYTLVFRETKRENSMNLPIQSEQERGNFMVRLVKYEDFILEMIRSVKAPQSADFLPAKVLKDNITWWSFKVNHPNYDGLAKLVAIGGEMVLALCSRDRKYVDQVIPVNDLLQMQQLENGEYVGGRKLQEFMKLKRSVAQKLRLEPHWTEREVVMRNALAKAFAEASAKKADAERKAGEERRSAMKKEKEERRAKIASRKRLHVFTATGDRRNGIPVVGDEWKLLGSDIFCVSVESFDAETGGVGKPVESFVTTRVKGAIDRAAVKIVTLDNPATPKRTALGKVSMVVMTLKGHPEEVMMAPDMDYVRSLNDEYKLNSGTLVACPKAGDEARYSVFRLKDGVIEPMTEVVRKIVS